MFILLSFCREFLYNVMTYIKVRYIYIKQELYNYKKPEIVMRVHHGLQSSEIFIKGMEV